VVGCLRCDLDEVDVRGPADEEPERLEVIWWADTEVDMMERVCVSEWRCFGAILVSGKCVWRAETEHKDGSSKKDSKNELRR
jgi:hypothetical protein